MTNMRKFAAALVLGLVMCLALFTTGAFAQSAHHGHRGGAVIVNATAIAIADQDNFLNGFGGFGGFGGCGCFNSCFNPFFNNGAFAHASVRIFGGGWDD